MSRIRTGFPDSSDGLIQLVGERGIDWGGVGGNGIVKNGVTSRLIGISAVGQ